MPEDCIAETIGESSEDLKAMALSLADDPELGMQEFSHESFR